MAGKTKKRRFGKRLTLFREAVNKLEPAHRVPHVVTVLGVAMGLTEEKIREEIGLASAMFGHLADQKAEKLLSPVQKAAIEAWFAGLAVPKVGV